MVQKELLQLFEGLGRPFARLATALEWPQEVQFGLAVSGRQPGALSITRAHATDCAWKVMISVILVSHLWSLLLLKGSFEPPVFIFYFYQGEKKKNWE